MTETGSKPVTVESALRSIIAASQDRSLTEKRVRTQVWGYAKAAIELLEAQASVMGAASTAVSADVPVVAWLHIWSGMPNAVRATLADDKYGLSEAIPLCFDGDGEILAWRWADGGGYNSRHRYSFVDPLEYPEEVEAQGAESVIGCKPLYRHPWAEGYKA